MSLQMLEIATEKLERLHAEAADGHHVRLARSVSWTDVVRWIRDRLGRG